MFKKCSSAITNSLFKQGISMTAFISLIAFYQATVLNIVYYKQILLRLLLDSVENIIFFLSMPVVVFCVIYLVLNLLCFKHLIKLVAIIFVLAGAPLAYFMMKFGIVIDRSIIESSLKTNQAEGLSYLTLSLVMYCVLGGVLPAILISFTKIKAPTNKFYYLLRRVLSAIVALAVVGLIAIFLYKNYAAFMRNNNMVVKYLMPSNYISAVYSEYDYIKYSNLPRVSIGDDVVHNKQHDNGKPNIFVLIVGETARAQNFSLNGYSKPTNSLLAKRDGLINFTDVSSCGTYTAYSVPCMFSNMARTEYDAKLARRQDNVLDILNKAQVNVTWLDNDSGCQGVCNNVESVDLTKKYTKENSEMCSTSGTCFDDVLLAGLNDKLTTIEQDKQSQLAKDNLIVLHMIGSHGPTYYQRYPDQFKQFTPSCDTNEINLCDNNALINTYDNTIAYTDYVIDQTITQLQQYQQDYNVGLIYLSDHGESLGENGVYLHSLPYSIAPDTQTQIPLMLWLSSDYQKTLNVKVDCLTEQAMSKTYSQDNLFHTLLSSFGLQTKEYKSQLDIYSACQL